MGKDKGEAKNKEETASGNEPTSREHTRTCRRTPECFFPPNRQAQKIHTHTIHAIHRQTLLTDQHTHTHTHIHTLSLAHSPAALLRNRDDRHCPFQNLSPWLARNALQRIPCAAPKKERDIFRTKHGRRAMLLARTAIGERLASIFRLEMTVPIICGSIRQSSTPLNLAAGRTAASLFPQSCFLPHPSTIQE